MKKQRVIVWFRQDLRLHDNEALTDAIKSGEEVIPVYVFDERVFKEKTRFGFKKTENFRAKFIIESVQDLKKSLQKLGSNLIIRIGKPEEEIFQIARKAKSSWVFCNRERTEEEVKVQDALERNLWAIGQEVRFSRGKMLYYTQDLPFPITHCPDVFTSFRKEVEKFVPVRAPLPAPTEEFKSLTLDLEEGTIPTLEELGLEEVVADVRAVLSFKGGESEGLKRLDHYLWQTDAISKYKETRNGLLGADYSSKFSLWLAHGCLSPKMIYHELKRYEEERNNATANDSTYMMFFELLWRDFFRFMGKKHGNKIFQIGGTKGDVNRELKNNNDLLKLWTDGRTGVPFICLLYTSPSPRD